MKQSDNTDTSTERQPDGAALISGPALTRTEVWLHRFAEQAIPGSGDALVAINRVAKGRSESLGMAIAIRFFLTMNSRQECFDTLVGKVEKNAATRKGPKADRHAAAVVALRDLAKIAGLTHREATP